MQNKEKSPAEIFIIEILIPVVLTGFFFFYTIFSKKVVETQADEIVYFFQLILGAFLGPVLLVIDFLERYTGWHTGIGLGMKFYYYTFFTILTIISVFQWLS